jgi:hypothetical protein
MKFFHGRASGSRQRRSSYGLHVVREVEVADAAVFFSLPRELLCDPPGLPDHHT